MHTFTKQQLDVAYIQAIFSQPKVRMVKLTEDDIIQYKLYCKSQHENNITVKVNEFEPKPKKTKPNEPNEPNEQGTEVLKLVLSREGETDTFKSQFKSAIINSEKQKTSSSNSSKHIIENNSKKVLGESKESSLEPMESTKHTEPKESSKHTEPKESSKHKEPKESSKRTESKKSSKHTELTESSVSLEFVKPSEPDKSKESTKSTKSTGAPKSKKSTKPIKSKSNDLIGKIRVRDPRTMMTEDKVKNFFISFLDKEIPAVINGGKKKAFISANVSVVNNISSVVRGGVSLYEIENLYKKYFTKDVQDTIVIIANILNVISLSNKHHKARMDESFKKKTEAEKLKERCDANRLHVKHKKVLESKLKNNFLNIVSSFTDQEFKPAFQMFFLSILTVLRVVDQPKFKKGSIFKNLVLLLWNSLRSSEYENPDIFLMFKSKTFRPDCIDLISLIEDSRDNDPGITDRMALFFVSSVNSREFFQPVIAAVTTDTNDDLGLLIENAALQCRNNSRFKDPPNVSPLKKCITNKTIITPFHNTNKSNDTIQQHWILAKTPNGSYQPIPVSNDNITPKTTNSFNIESSLLNQPMNAFYENFSNSLIKVSSESIVPKVIAPKGNVSIVPTSTVSKTSLGQGATLVAIKSSAIHNLKPITTATIQKSDGNTIILGNKQYQLVSRNSMNHMRPVTTTSNIVIKTAKAPPKQVPELVVKCFAINCNNPAKIMCSTCTTVKYCSHNCQRKDWYEVHINNCDQLRQQRN